MKPALDDITTEAVGNQPASLFFSMIAAGTLGPGIGQASTTRVYGYGPLRGHVSLLTAIARLIDAKVIVELGTGTGIGTRAFMEACRYTGGHVWSVDKDPTVGKAALEGDPRVTFIVDTTTHAGKRWDRAVDLVYVDADHSRKSAMDDMEAWLPHGPKAFLLDDTMDSNDPHGSPLEAAEDFCRRHGWTMWNIPVGTGLCIVLPGFVAI